MDTAGFFNCPAVVRGWREVEIRTKYSIVFFFIIMEISREYFGGYPPPSKLAFLVILAQNIEAMFEINHILRKPQPILFLIKVVIDPRTIIFDAILVLLLYLVECIFWITILLLLNYHDLVLKFQTLVYIKSSFYRYPLRLPEELRVQLEQLFHLVDILLIVKISIYFIIMRYIRSR